MGLDCFWMDKRGNTVYLKFEPPLNLTGGLCSEHGNGSFRGKVYEDVIRELTGHTLYVELDECEIKDIAEKLERAKLSEIEGLIERDEFEDLKRMFKEYSRVRGIRLVPYF
ncbi:MAG: hypothetical protein J7J80_01840 [Thermotogae bacterium]|nr:hypothetical protein [Thermotogota bacterium]